MKSVQYLIVILFFCQPLFSQVKEFHTKNYGAVGDGINDDKVSLQNCLKDAYLNDGVMIIDYGRYKIKKALYVYVKENKKVKIVGSPNQKGELPVLITDSLESLIVCESNPNKPAGAVDIEGLELVGNNVPFSKTHPYFGKHDVYASGIGAFNIKEVILKSNIIRNIYGEGINIRNWNYAKNLPANRTVKVDISDNKILNCWGANPPVPGKKGPSDEYGDGIYLGNVLNFNIKNNMIVNDLTATKQFGRAGIVIEDLCENGIVEGNTINGYDRDMHLEADLGGYLIQNNKFTGSDYGICIYSVLASSDNKPITIKDNYFSNENIPVTNSLVTARGMSERAFISFYTKNDSRKGSIVSNNKFYMSTQSGIIGKAFMKIYQKGMVLNNNTYNNITSKQVEIYFDQKPDKVSDESYKNVNVLFNSSSGTDFYKANNKMINSKSNVNL